MDNQSQYYLVTYIFNREGAPTAGNASIGNEIIQGCPAQWLNKWQKKNLESYETKYTIALLNAIPVDADAVSEEDVMDMGDRAVRL